MTPTPHPHLPRLPDIRQPSSVLAADDFDLAARLFSLTGKHGGDVVGAPLPPSSGLKEAQLQRTSFFRPSSRLSAAIRYDDHELASLLGFDIELQRCSVLVDPHCGNPKGLITALLSMNDPFKIPRWFVRRSRQVPVLLAPTAARVTRRCTSVKQKLRSMPYICKPKHDCFVCRTTIRERELRLRCGHYYHVECLLHLIEASTNDQSLFPPRCCDQPIREKVFQRHMPPTLASTYREKAAEFSTIRRVYCSNPACSRFLGPRTEPELAINYYCAVCTTRTCSGCRLGVSTGAVGQPHVCRTDHGQREVIVLAREKGWTRCPACDQMIELHSGCYHMTCVCAAQFCYACGSPWKTCSCPQWEQVELREFDVPPAHPIRPPPIDAARPPTPPPKPIRPEGGFNWQGSLPRSAGLPQLQARSGVPPKENPRMSLNGRPRSLHSAGLAARTQQGSRDSAYGIASGTSPDEWVAEAASPSLGSLGLDCRVLEGGLMAQRRRGISMPRPSVV